MPVVAALKQTNNLIRSTICEVGLDAPPPSVFAAARVRRGSAPPAISTTVKTKKRVVAATGLTGVPRVPPRCAKSASCRLAAAHTSSRRLMRRQRDDDVWPVRALSAAGTASGVPAVLAHDPRQRRGLLRERSRMHLGRLCVGQHAGGDVVAWRTGIPQSPAAAAEEHASWWATVVVDTRRKGRSKLEAEPAQSRWMRGV